MKKFIPLYCLLLLLAGLSVSAADILYNQIGYYTHQTKLFVASDSTATTFELIDAETDVVVLSGNLTASENYLDGGIIIRRGDFSTHATEGSYYIRLNDATESAPFTIGDNIQREAFLASLKGLYYNRSTQEITQEFGGVYARPLGHPDESVQYHSSTGRPDGFSASPKGWYDAGDFGKYIVNGGYALGTLLSLYELNPNFVPDNTNIPESGNGVSDLLDECRWEIEWFLTMQDTDGGVFHKLSTLRFVGMQLPHIRSVQRYFIGKGTAASLNFAACMAQSARIFKTIDPTLSSQCLTAAKKAWNWAEANPEVRFTNPAGVSTGEYGDSDFSDEFVWAAAQLYITTADARYLPRLTAQLSNPTVDTSAWWGGLRNFGLYSLATVDSNISASDKSRIRDAIVVRADEIITQIESNPLRIPMTTGDFGWGSNGTIAAKGVVLAYAFEITQDTAYINKLIHIADYLMGRNATTYSFLTGFGNNPPMNIHHRISVGDGIAAPVPGLLAGGPNSLQQDYRDVGDYTYNEPARSYMDVEPSFASNEIAINWNTPYTLILGMLDMNTDPSANPQAPVEDTYSLSANHTFSTSFMEGLLGNDFRPGNAEGSLTVMAISLPPLGDFELQKNGSFTYTPPDGFAGNLYLEYIVHSETSISDPVKVTLIVYPENNPLPLTDNYSAWLWAYPGLSDTDPEADPNGNGFSNYLDYAYGNDPSTPYTVSSIDTVYTGNDLLLSIQTWSDYLQRNISFEIEYAYDLKNPVWHKAGEGTNISFHFHDLTPSNREGISNLLLKADSPMTFPVFIRIKRGS